MLPPNELKNKTFTRVMRGYNPDEVNEHIDFVIQKYEELYRENDRLERKLKTVTAQLEAIRKDEEAIRLALINAQRAGATIVSEANERAEVIMRAAKTNCDKVLGDFRGEIRRERDAMAEIRTAVHDFKEELFRTYQRHIEYIAGISDDPSAPSEVIPEELLVRRAIDSIKESVAQYSNASMQKEQERTAPVIADSEEDYPEDTDAPLEEETAKEPDNTAYLDEIFQKPNDDIANTAVEVAASADRFADQAASFQTVTSRPFAQQKKEPQSEQQIPTEVPFTDDRPTQQFKLPSNDPGEELHPREVIDEEDLQQIELQPMNPDKENEGDGLKASISRLNHQIRSSNPSPAAKAEASANAPTSDVAGDDADYLEFIRNISGDTDTKQIDNSHSKHRDHGKKKRGDDFDTLLDDLNRKG